MFQHHPVWSTPCVECRLTNHKVDQLIKMVGELTQLLKGGEEGVGPVPEGDVAGRGQTS